MLRTCGYNSVLREGVTVTGITTASLTDTPATDVLNDDLSRFWRGGEEPALAFRNSGTRYKKAECVYLVDHTLDGYSLLGDDGNVVAADSWQVQLSSGELSLYQAPTSIQEQTNFTGTAFTERSSFREPDAYLIPTNPLVLSRVRARFALPHAGVTLAASQIFRFRALALGPGSCTYTVRLKEGGVLRATLASGSITYPDDSVLGGTWSASSLVSTGVPEIEIEITPGTTSAKVAAATWHPVIASSTDPAYYDSGLIPIVLPPTYRASDQAVLTAVHFFPAPRDVKTLYLSFRPTSGPVEVGRVDCGMAPSFDVKRDSYRVRLVDPSVAVEMRGGNYRYHRRRKFLEAEVSTIPTRIAEALASMYEGIERQIGMTEALLWLFDSENVHGGYLPIFGNLKGLNEYGNIQRFFEHGFSVRQAR